MARAYTSSAAVNNPLACPPVPKLVRSYEQRRAVMGKSNGRWKHGKGRARRHYREVHVKHGLELRRALLAGERTFRDRAGRRWTVRELMAHRFAKHQGTARAVQHRVRQLVDAISAHGPWSGWAVAQPVEGAETRAKWTPYEVPKAGEQCWRWWRKALKAVVSLLPWLAHLAGEPIPLHRPAPETTEGGEKQEACSSPTTGEGTTCRDRSVREVVELFRSLELRFGM